MNAAFLKRVSTALLLFCLALGIGCHTGRGTEPRAREGVLDLSQDRLSLQDPVRLDGEWRFYWNQLLNPADFTGASRPSLSGHLVLPRDWNGEVVQGHTLGGSGYATLNLKVLLPLGHPPLALRLYGINSAYRLWVNGQPVAESGQVGRRTEEARFDPSVRMVPIRRDHASLDLVLQVSNFHFHRGGVPVSILLGGEAAMTTHQNQDWGLALFFIGSLLVMGIYHLAFYCFRRTDRAAFHFGIYCLVWAASMLISDSSGWVVRLFLPDLSAEYLYRVCQVLLSISLPIGYLFFRTLYPQEFPDWLFRICLGQALLFTPIALGAPLGVVSAGLSFYYLFCASLILFVLWALFRAWQRERMGASYLLWGFFLLGVVSINDMLYDMRLIQTGFMIHVGMFLFILFQAMALSQRFARAFSAIETLSSELVHKNLSLEEEMTERIRLEREIVQISEDERRRVSHELHDGLCQLLTGARLRCSVLMRKCPKETASVAELTQLSSLLDDSVDHAYNLARGLWPVEHEPKDVCTSLEGLVQRLDQSSGVRLAFHPQTPCTVCTNAHVTQLYHIAQEAISNALKHARPTRIMVSLDCLCRHTVTLVVQDDGVGRRAAKKTKGGMGMKIMAHRARMLGGTLHIEDGEGQGTIVRCSVPCEGRAIHLKKDEP